MDKVTLLLFFVLSTCFKISGQTLNLNDTTFVLHDSLVTDQLYHPDCQIQMSKVPFLDSLANFLIQNSNVTILIEFHSDLRGNAEANKRTGEVCGTGRIKAFFNGFYPNIDKSRIEYISYGESKPIVTQEQIDAIDNSKEKERVRSKNRRTVIKILRIK